MLEIVGKALERIGVQVRSVPKTSVHKQPGNLGQCFVPHMIVCRQSWVLVLRSPWAAQAEKDAEHSPTQVVLKKTMLMIC